MSLVIGILVGMLMLMLLVTAHEFGHFIMARRNGVEVEEFGICFPPRAIAWRKVDGKWKRISKSQWKKMPGEGLVISLNWLPIGGFCQMKGESDADERKGSFGRASFWGKTKILFGGVTANWLIAILVFTVLAWVGMPHFIGNQFQVVDDTKIEVITPVTVATVIEDSPASKAGLQENDEIVSVRSLERENAQLVDIKTVDELLAYDEEHRGEELEMVYKRNGDVSVTQVRLNGADVDYALGATIGGDAVYRSTWSAPIVGIGTTVQLTTETFKGVGKMLANLVSGAVKQINTDENVRESGAQELKSASDSVSGPVGIVGVLFPRVAQSGGRNLAFLVALISVSLACMNVLPIPALDGGRWMLIAIYRLRKKKLTKEKEEKIVGRAFMAILAFAAIVTVLDIVRIVK